MRITPVILFGDDKGPLRREAAVEFHNSGLDGVRDILFVDNRLISPSHDLGAGPLKQGIVIGGEHIHPRQFKKLHMEAGRFNGQIRNIGSQQVLQRRPTDGCLHFFSQPQDI